MSDHFPQHVGHALGATESSGIVDEASGLHQCDRSDRILDGMIVALWNIKSIGDSCEEVTGQLVFVLLFGLSPKYAQNNLISMTGSRNFHY